MTIGNDDAIRAFLADESRRAVASAPSLDMAVGRLAPRIDGRPSSASPRLVVLLAATLLLVAALGTAIAVGSGILRLPAVIVDDPEFEGAWASTNYNDYVGADRAYSQTMTVRAGEVGAFTVTVRDESSFACSDAPMTMTGAGRLEEPTTLVVPSPVLACVDGSDPAEGLSGLDAGRSYELVHDAATDRLYDSLGVVWNRGEAPARRSASATQGEVEERGRFSILHGEVAFRAAPPWGDHPEAYIDPRLFFLVGPGHTAAAGAPQAPRAEMTILVNPLAPEAPCGGFQVPPSAEELVQAIRSNPDLETTVPITQRVGRIDALQMDVVAAPGGSIGPCGAAAVDVVYVPGRAWGGVGPGDLGRVYILDLPGGSARTLAILITAPDADVFRQALDAAVPILESFEFHAS